MGAKITQAVPRIAFGIYTGDGAATQVISGIGFEPYIVFIFPHKAYASWVKTSGMGSWAKQLSSTPTLVWLEDTIISLDSDGFTVGDSTSEGIPYLNEDETVYTYLAIKWF